MEGYNLSSLPYGDDPLSVGNVGTGDYGNMLLGIGEQGGLYDTGDFGV